MTMQLVNLVQGSPEWHAHRRNHFNASDAPAMMGASSYKSRSELIKELATGITEEIDAATQRRFDDGHQFEAWARPMAEKIIGDGLSNCVGTRGKYSASFDGLTFMNDTAFEHKTLNNTLREILAQECTGADLPLQYRVQMEQQAMVSGCDRILFMASKWTAEGLPVEAYHCWYEPDAELRAQIIAGWEQIEKDVAAYQPEASTAVPVVATRVAALPTVVVQVTGSIAVTDNFDEFEMAAKAFLETKLIREPKADQDFADLEAQIRQMKAAEDALDASESQMLAQVEAVYSRKQRKDMLHALIRDNRLLSEKLVKTEKDRLKAVLVSDAQQDLNAHVAALNKRLGSNWLPQVVGGFAETIKGLKSLDSMRDKVAVALTNAKLQAQTTANTLLLNRDFLRSDGSGQDWITLFPDFPAMGVKEPEVFKAMATMRINDFKQAEAQRLDAERAQIRAEEEAKAKREAEAERDRIRAEEQAKAQAEAAAQRQQVQQQAQEAQADIAQAHQAGTLSKPLAEDLAGLVAEQAAEGVASIDAQQAISTAMASSAVVQATDEPTMTLGQINTRLEAEGLGKISAATLEHHSIPFEKKHAAVHIQITQVRRLMLLMSMGTRKFADELQTTTV
ncbi:MAG: YqaJ viral recombinase family protein [Comamonas sp.]|jgi:putative phage-type endonuclease|uniref:YqaJ viral recombinase family protein n=1 Tax=Comamonas sp. TaxID=34028 RepID=UPI00282431A6|nr:YqaJ viral recombinase family protein [Comamonas sp.]MDR0215944.1 YqaJ viral recombinase family protein [Comamonas sp.]